MYQLMTTQSLALAQELDGQISAIAQRHATSQLAKNTLTNLSARPDELLFQAFVAFSDVSFLRSGTIEVRTTHQVLLHTGHVVVTIDAPCC